MQPTSELITIERDCEAILIPSGDPIKLVKGTHVRITQALGGDYTLFVNGNLVKISGADADAIGKEPEEEKSDVQKKTGEPVKEEQVWEQLRTVYDPEIPINVVDLGLIYNCDIKKDDKDDYCVSVDMTLTAPGCGMGPAIAMDAETKIRNIPGVIDVLVEIVWEPLWDRDMMSEEAKLELGMM